MPAKGREMALGMVRTFTARSKYYLTFPYSLTFLHWICFTFGVKNNINKGREKRKPEERKEKQLEAAKFKNKPRWEERAILSVIPPWDAFHWLSLPCSAYMTDTTMSSGTLEADSNGTHVTWFLLQGQIAQLCFVGVCSYCFLNYALFYSLVS